MTNPERVCGGVFDSHTGTDLAVYKVIGRAERTVLCSGCGDEAVRRGAIVLEKRADPARPDRGSRWPIGPLGRRLLGLAR